MDTTPARAGMAAMVKQEPAEDAAVVPPSLAPFTASSAFPTVAQDVAVATASVPGAALPLRPAGASMPGPAVVDHGLGRAQAVLPLFTSQPGLSSASSFVPGYSAAPFSNGKQIPPLASSKLDSMAQELRLEAEKRMTQGAAPKRPRLVVHSGAEAHVNDLIRTLRDATRRIEAAANGNFRRPGQGQRPRALRDIGKAVDVLRRQVQTAQWQQNAWVARQRLNHRRTQKQRAEDKIFAGLRARLWRLNPQQRREAHLKIQEALQKVEFGSTSE